MKEKYLTELCLSLIRFNIELTFIKSSILFFSQLLCKTIKYHTMIVWLREWCLKMRKEDTKTLSYEENDEKINSKKCIDWVGIIINLNLGT